LRQSLLAYCAIVQGTTIKVRPVIAERNNKIAAGSSEETFDPNRFVVGIDV
jgi:hypothetical protein